MMKSFKQFIKQIAPILIPVDPVHGEHSKTRKFPKEPTLIPSGPVHGTHSKPKSLKEAAKHYVHPDPYDDEHIGYNPEHADPKSWVHEHDNHHLGADHKEVHHKINMDRATFKKHPGAKEVHSYTEFSHGINHNLLLKAKKEKPTWETHADDEEDKKEIKKDHDTHVKNIDKAIKHSKLKHDLHVYHGTHKFNPGELASQHPERKIKSAAYMSASLHKKVAHRFSGAGSFQHNGSKGHILHIHLKKGQHAMYVGANSEYHSEHEAILPRNSTLKIHHKPTKLKDGTHVWHAKVVDDKK